MIKIKMTVSVTENCINAPVPTFGRVDHAHVKKVINIHALLSSAARIKMNGDLIGEVKNSEALVK